MKAELIDYLGNDITVVNAARVSFDKASEWDKDNNYELSVKDQKLINYLARHDHFTPFTHVQITMRETVPIFIARQRFKHSIGFSYNEVSRRYVSDEPSFFAVEQWRLAAENKKQGSSDEVLEGRDEDVADEAYAELISHANSTYERLLELGVAPEQARMVLPQSMLTSYYCTGSLAAWARAYKLRIDPHAQLEIQQLAHQWGDIIGNINELKYSWGALTSSP